MNSIPASSSILPINPSCGSLMTPAHLLRILCAVLLVVVLEFLFSYTTTVNSSYFFTRKKFRKKLVKNDEFPFANGTALVMRTVAPIRVAVLDRIYQLAVEHHRHQSKYDFWLLVDETQSQNSQQRLSAYFARHGGAAGGEVLATLRPPRIFAVSETSLLARYPNITSYIYNEPEPNFNNEAGLCCDRPIMWQMFLPTFGMFMENHKQYRYAWTFEDDIAVAGELSLFDQFRKWDWRLLNESVDLAAPMLTGFHWGLVRHTQNMEVIAQAMQNASVEWRMYSDAVQRHSRSLAQSIVTEVGNNVMQFGERLVHPIAWKHNHTIVDLAQLSLSTENNSSTSSTVFGLDALTGAKLTRSQGVERLLNLSESPEKPFSFVFHEELPIENRRRLFKFFFN